MDILRYHDKGTRFYSTAYNITLHKVGIKFRPTREDSA